MNALIEHDVWGKERGAVLTEDEAYRYLLWRLLPDAYTRRVALWVMLNPSIADALKDDATIRRVVSFSKMFGFGLAMVVNLFAFRETNPKKLLVGGFDRAVGLLNDVYLDAAVSFAFEQSERSKIVCAWGNDGWIGGRGASVAHRLRNQGHVLHVLGTTHSGQPLHPVRLSKTLQLKEWR